MFELLDSMRRCALPMNRSGWLTVLGSFLAATTSSGVILTMTFSVFVKPIGDEFGWSRAFVSLGYTAALISIALFLPVIGRLFDRFGVRSVLLWFVMLFSLSIVFLSITPNVPVIFVALYAVVGAFGGGHSSVPYAKIVSSWFDRRRGVALGITMAGVGVGGALLPQVARALMDLFGWRLTHLGIGLIVFTIAMPAVLWLIREPVSPSSVGGIAASVVGTHDVQRARSVTTLFRDTRVWLIVLPVFLMSMAVSGITTHMYPLLVDRGIDSATAGSLLTGLGLATLIGRIATGFLLDRFFAPYVAVGTVILTAIGALVLWNAARAPVLGVVLLGLGLGAEMDVMGYLVSRYFDASHFGEVFGFVMSVFALAAGLGAPLMGYSFDRTGTYDAALVGFAAGLSCSVVPLLRLGPYAYPPSQIRTRP